jgi:hypothetical protein
MVYYFFFKVRMEPLASGRLAQQTKTCEIHSQSALWKNNDKRIRCGKQ